MRIVGIDGEAVVPRGYCLLASSEPEQLVSDTRLRSVDCFRFLLDASSRSDRMFGYGIGFDVCHWIADLEDDEKRRLAESGRCYTLQGGSFYRVVYRPGAFFSVSLLDRCPLREGGAKSVSTATVVDLMRWHRRPFADTCLSWDCLSGETAEMLTATKGIREVFSPEMMEGICEYNAVECHAIEELARFMLWDARRSGLSLSHPFTAGTVAGALAHRYKVKDQRREQSAEIETILPVAFFGGREQCSRYGHFPEARQWDIRSAYGWALLQLPDMLGTWQHIRAFPRLKEWGLWRVSWDFEEGSFPLFPFPWRDDKGRIHYPPRGQGWYWSPMVRAAYRHYPADRIQVHEGWMYTPDTDGARPFAYIGDLYDKRVLLGIDPAQGMLKSLIVSTWGRLCSQGTRRSPTRGLLDWSGMTTALIQERLLDGIFETGADGFIACCVDGFWTRSKRKLSYDSGDYTIGNWYHRRDAELMLVSPLHYWARTGEVWLSSLAGVPGGMVLAEDAIALWEEKGFRGKLPFSRRRCVGLLSAHRSGDFTTMGSFISDPGELALHPGLGHECPTQRGRDGWRRWLQYWPPVPVKGAMSHPYRPRRGMLEKRWGQAATAEEVEEMIE